MLSFILDVRLLLLALLAWFLTMGAGCKFGTTAEAESLRANLETIEGFAQETGAEAEAEVFISPNGSVGFGPAVNYSNGSFIKARLKFDPQKAKLTNKALAGEVPAK